ncbi:conserved hypothetical protein [Candidatus Glomeribacter gigasporarum BEG34]|uniref:Cyclodipeptide synthase n=2 Tax=Candidatus Glomeribacter gigasporarum BEG34 TaxID=1070319 RepID=G2JBB2_9BURK|nr:hypothetical protein [Candidatus Glomeribacter gigasporarum]CCD30066.1 conserved hypothetical protein [Candidatus Glomeribacter gigasporarum BEG34]
MAKIAYFKGLEQFILENSLIKNKPIKIVIGISMQSPHQISNEHKQSGDSFRAFVDLLRKTNEQCIRDENNNESAIRISELIVVITDGLHRHNLRLYKNVSTTEAESEAAGLGQKWVADNRQFLEAIGQCGISYKVIHWEELKSVAFNRYLQIVEEEYEKPNSEFRSIIDNLTQTHLEKLVNFLLETRDSSFTQEDCVSATRKYLLEEAASAFEFASLKADGMTYPGPCSPGFKYIYDTYLSESNPLPFIEYGMRGGKKLPSFWKEESPVENALSGMPDEEFLIHHTSNFSN